MPEILAAEIIAVSDRELQKKIINYKKRMADESKAKNEKIE
ncbi:MAG: hypothetical protein U5K00_03620 [Melioribacteraceae bacterium]|nr:hypothetical protein [Melioribacteraceae bacterium]